MIVAPAGAVVLLAVAGAAARRPLDGGGAAPPLPAWPLLVLVGVGLVAAGAIVASALWPPPRRYRGLEREPLLQARAGPLTVALALLVPIAIVALLVAPAGHHGARQAPSLPGVPQIRPHTTTTDATRDRGTAGAAALAAGIAVGLLGVAVVVLAGRRGRQDGPGDDARAVVADATRDALAELAMPSDPREGVLVAYARMQAALAEAGLSKRPSEAPREYLSRLAASLGGGRGPAERLTGLFERARFSTHPIGEDVRREAFGALDDLRAELEGPG